MSAADYTLLDLHDQILLRPGVYIHSTVNEKRTMWIYDGEMQSRKIEFNPGLYKIVDEILVNAADNKQTCPSMTYIKVALTPTSISVENNGVGIVNETHPDAGVLVPEMIFGILLTSSNYNDAQERTTGGQNGYGAKLTNIFSKRFIVENTHFANRTSFRKEWRNNMKDSDPATLFPTAESGKTRIYFEPDFAKFGVTCFSEDMLAVLTRRVYDIAGTSGVTVYLSQSNVPKPIPIRNFADYCRLYSSEIYFDKVGTWEVGIARYPSHKQISFVNSISTPEGGPHVNLVLRLIHKYIITLRGKADITETAVRNQTMLFINCQIGNPSFTTQCKDKLSTPSSKFSQQFSISEAFAKCIVKSGIPDAAKQASTAKEEKKLINSSATTRKATTIRGLPKLSDANKAGTAESAKCTLILTEGDSAKTLAVSGFSVVGRDYYGAFPLKGKLLNVREQSYAKIAKNEEITAIVKILGLEYQKVYTDLKSLRYGRLMIMADQDYDGSHIKGLVINFIHYNWPSLLQLGFIQEFITPIVTATKGKELLRFFTIQQYETWAASSKGPWVIKYYKGLGTSTSAEAKSYFGDLAKHKVDFTYQALRDDELIDMAFNKKLADKRKAWILAHSGQFIDTSSGSISYSQFINNELVLFSIASCQRAIPSVIDGFKPSQRKILYGCLKRKAGSTKVAQLSGYIAEKTAYHHGEVSLQEAIIGMAQDYVGSNNLPLLVPEGQFGSRQMNGADSASPRYIFTDLQPYTRLIFPDADNGILKYLDDDGNQIEPEYFIPIIPMVLVNGALGIGTGWSTNVCPCSVTSVIQRIEAMLDNSAKVGVKTHFRGFTGRVFREGTSIKTEVTPILEGTYYRVTELPIGVSVVAYKEFLDSKGFLFTDLSSDTQIDFTVKGREDGEPVQIADLGLTRKTDYTSSNMYLFDSAGKIRKFDTGSDIIEHYFNVRLDAYVRRKAYLVNLLELELARMTNRARFIKAIVDEQLVVAKRIRAELVAEMETIGFTDISELLRMSISSMTQDEVDRLLAECDRISSELYALKAKSAKDLWKADLQLLKAALV